MTTTIDELTYELRVAASGFQSEAVQSNLTRPALRHLGRALQRLSQRGLTPDDRNYRREATVDELATACLNLPRILAGDDREPNRRDRLTEVAAALADASVVRGARATSDERWAIAVHLAADCYSLTTFAPITVLPHDLRWVRHYAHTVVRWELPDHAPLAATAVLDAPIPSIAGARGAPVHAATTAAAALRHRLENHRDGRVDPASAWEVLAITKAAAATSRIAAAICTTLGAQTTHAAADAWRAVEGQLFPFLVNRVPISTSGDVVNLCLAIYTGVRDTFAPATGLPSPARPRLGDVRALQQVINQFTPIADSLNDVLARATYRGDLHAHAHRLAFRESRIGPFLQKQPVIADDIDLVPTTIALQLAGGLSAHLALTLTDASGGTNQPALAAALAQRLDSGPPVAQMADAARWHVIALDVDRKLTCDPGWPQLAATMQEINDHGRDARSEVDRAMRRGPLPREGAARALDDRLRRQVDGLPAVRPIADREVPLPPRPCSSPARAAGRPTLAPRAAR